MPNPVSSHIQQKQLQNHSQKQMQRLMMSSQMQQAIHLLQLPVLELASLIESELEQNPIIECSMEEFEESDELPFQQKELEIEPNDNFLNLLAQCDENNLEISDEAAENRIFHPGLEKQHSFMIESIPQKASLYEHLIEQARETLQNSEDLALADAIIGNLDANGYLQTSLEEIALLNGTYKQKLESLLEIIQTFEPVGIGARNLQESLLIQLKVQNKQNTLAAQMIAEHFEDLLHNRLPLIQKKLSCPLEEILEAIKCHIAPLDLHPGTLFSKQVTQYIIPDIILKQVGENFVAQTNHEFIPNWRIKKNYLEMFNAAKTSKDVKEFIKQKTSSANWLMQALHQRSNTLERIMLFLSKKQRDFFINSSGNLVPLTMKMVAQELELHESTIARAVANKYADTPRGMLPLHFFFGSSYQVDNGMNLSSNGVKAALLELIQKEDKNHPLSDQELAKNLRERGIHCARRTISKHRQSLKIGNTRQRRQYQP